MTRLARIATLAWVLLAWPSLGSPPPVVAEAPESFTAEADRLLETLLAGSGTPAFQAAVGTPDGLVWSGVIGMADLEDRIAATSDTRFGIGSISKSLTMVLALRLAERGMLDLDAPIETYLEDYPHAGHGVTIRLIATHLSGLSDELGSAMRTTTRHFDSPTLAYAVLRDEPLTAEPGKRHLYTTGPFTLIGAAIESATGRGFAELMREHVLDPSGMTQTEANDRTRDLGKVAAFYLQGSGESQPDEAAPYDPSYKLPGAGYLATAEDLCRFGTALLDDTLLSEASRSELWTAAADASGGDTGFGLGFRVDALEDGTPVMHQPGGGIGISCWLFVFPVERVSVAVLSNQTSAPAGGAEVLAVFERALAVARAGELDPSPWRE